MTSLRYQYQTIEFGKSDIHLRTLRNRQEYSDDKDIAEKLGISSANWSLFGIVWDSSKVLANYMFEYEFEDKKILEVGCGIALSMPNAKSKACRYHCNRLPPRSRKFSS